MKRQGFSLGFDRTPRLSQWNKGFVTFSAGLGDSVNAWRAPVADDGRIVGRAERLTAGTALEVSPLLGADGDVIFASLNRSSAVWGVAAAPDHGSLQGDFKKISNSAADLMPSISSDGRTLAFTAAHKWVGRVSGEGAERPREAVALQTVIRDLATGKETAVSRADASQWHPQISHDGSIVAYTSGKPGRIYTASVHGESARLMTGEGNFFAWDWSRGEARLLFNGPGQQVHLLDMLSGSEKLFLSRDGFLLY